MLKRLVNIRIEIFYTFVIFVYFLIYINKNHSFPLNINDIYFILLETCLLGNIKVCVLTVDISPAKK